jgi:hypothetical protein
MLRLARARLLDWGVTGARRGATTRPQPWRIEGGAATANTTLQVCYMACNGMQSQLLPRAVAAIACYQCLSCDIALG